MNHNLFLRDSPHAATKQDPIMEATDVTAKTREFRTRIETAALLEEAKKIAAEFHAYYATLTPEQKRESDQDFQRVVEREREDLAAIERMLEALGQERKRAEVV